MTFSVEEFDIELNRNVIHIYQNYEHYRKNCMGVAEYYKEKRREMNLRGMDWRDKELIKGIQEQKQKDEEYEKQKQVDIINISLKRLNSRSRISQVKF